MKKQLGFGDEELKASMTGKRNVGFFKREGMGPIRKCQNIRTLRGDPRKG